jgi:hypothetical protein
VPFQLQTTVQAEVDPALAPRITSFSIGVGNPAGISPDQNVILHAPHAGPTPTHWRASDVSAAALQSAPWKVYAPDAPGALFHGPFASHGRKTVWFQYRAGAAASAVVQDDVEYGWAEYAIAGKEAILHAAARGFRFGASRAGGSGTCSQGADWVPLAGYGYDHLYLSEAVAFRQDVGAIVSIVYSELTCEFSFFQGRQLRQGWRTKRIETGLVNPPMEEGYPLPSFGASALNVKPFTTASRDASFTVHYRREARTFDLVAGILLGPARDAFPTTQTSISSMQTNTRTPRTRSSGSCWRGRPAPTGTTRSCPEAVYSSSSGSGVSSAFSRSPRIQVPEFESATKIFPR